jgi:hypothetical protein
MIILLHFFTLPHALRPSRSLSFVQSVKRLELETDVKWQMERSHIIIGLGKMTWHGRENWREYNIQWMIIHYFISWFALFTGFVSYIFIVQRVLCTLTVQCGSVLSGRALKRTWKSMIFNQLNIIWIIGFIHFHFACVCFGANIPPNSPIPPVHITIGMI